MRKIILISALLLAPLLASAYTSPGKLSGFANDFAGVLTADQRGPLETKLKNFQASSGDEIAVAVIKSLDGDTVENYAVKLFEEWGIGQKGKDNGVLVLVAVDDHQIRIEVGYGLEGDLTDAQSFQVIDQIMKPAFRANDFYGGLDQATDAIISVLGGQPLALPATSQDSSGSFQPSFFIIFILGVWLLKAIALLGRSKSWWGGGVLGGIGGVILGIIKGLTFGLIAGAIFIPLGLLIDYILSKHYQAARARGVFPWWWMGGPRGGGGGGFGGFGGGRSGGGGASGGW